MEVQQITKISLVWDLYEQDIPKARIARQLGIHRETVHLWIKRIEKVGFLPFVEEYQRAKKGERKRRQIDPLLKRKIWAIREREYDCCGQKIQYFLKKEYGIKPAVSKIYEVLGEKYQLRSKWKTNKKRGSTPSATKAREVVQMDTVMFGHIIAFTAIDIFTKEADVMLSLSGTSNDGARFLNTCMPRRFNSFSETIQADGGPEFQGKFASTVRQYTNTFRVSRPYRKNEQSFIESFNRTVRKECLGWTNYNWNELPELNGYVEEFLNRYHYHRPHMSLGMRPPLQK